MKGQDDVCSVSFVRIGGRRCKTAAGVVGKCVPWWRKSPFAIRRSQAIPVLLWSGVWRDWQTSVVTVCWSFPRVCNLPVNHIWGPQTTQQAPPGELVMFSPLRSHSSLSKLLTIYLDVIIVCDIIKEENLHLCCPFLLEQLVIMAYWRWSIF